MTTLFAITGRQRHSLPHTKRRSYIHALDPIFEDSSSANMQNTNNADYSYMVDTYGQKAGRQVMSYHNYEEIFTENMDPMPRLPPRRYSSDNTHDIMKGSIQFSGILRENKLSTIYKNSNEQVRYQAEEGQYKSTLPNQKLSGDLNSDHKHSKCALNVHKDVAHCDSLENVPGLERGLEEALNNDGFIHTRSNSIYHCHTTLNINHSVGQSLAEKDLRSRWQKPDLKPLKDAHNTCPAEKKIKKHVFLACLVLLLGAICVLVVAIIDGWMIEKIGKGIKENMFKGRKIDISSNATHFPDYNNDTGLGNVTGNFFNNTSD